MKIQLLHDLQESGSAPASTGPADSWPPDSTTAPSPPDNPGVTPPMRPSRPAVWHGPGAQRAGAGAAVQRADAGSMQRAAETPARGAGVAIEAWAERAAQRRPQPAAPPSGPPPVTAAREPAGAPLDEPTLPGHAPRHRPEPAAGPQPFPDRPPRTDDVPPPRAPETTIPDPRVNAGTIPRPRPRPLQPEAEAEWLAARLRNDEALRDTPAWSSAWKRRLVTSSIAGGLLAGLAAGGLWLYEENRVDGALVVVANTSPAGVAPAAAPAAPGGAAQAFSAGSTAVAPASAAPPATVADVVRPLPADEVTSAPPSPGPMPQATRTAGAGSAGPVDVNPPKRAPRHAEAAHKRAAVKSRRAPVQDAPSVAPVGTMPSPRSRREETLMQCRAHGYDERQCIQRGCTMTRYGFACRG